MKWTRSSNSSNSRRPIDTATVVLPIPPAPTMLTKRPATNWAEIVSTASSRPIIRLKRAGSAGLFFEIEPLRSSSLDHGADKRIAPALDVRDVPVSEFAVPKRLSDRRHVNAETSLLDDCIRPGVIDEFLFSYDLAGTRDEKDQKIERPAAQGKGFTIA